MYKETYERLYMDVTQFDAEDIIVTSGEDPSQNRPPLHLGKNEYANGFDVPVSI